MFKNPLKKHKAKPFEDEQTKKANIEMFEEACEYGDLAEAKRLLETTSINLYSRDLLVLPLAAKKGHFNIVQFLVEKGVPLDADNGGALTYACAGGYLNIVQYLIESGADIHGQGNDPLINAAACGKLDVVQYLVRKGADIHGGYEDPLRYAATNGETEVVRYILDNWDIDLNGYFASKNSPLIAAVSSLNIETIKLLVDRGANTHTPGKPTEPGLIYDSEPSALIESLTMGELEVISYLYHQTLKAGMDIDKDGLFVRLCDPKVSQRPDAVQFFIEQGVDIHTQNDKAFKDAASVRDLAIATVLFNEEPAYFSSLIQNDPELSLRQDLIAMANHQKLGAILDEDKPNKRSRARL